MKIDWELNESSMGKNKHTRIPSIKYRKHSGDAFLNHFNMLFIMLVFAL